MQQKFFFTYDLCQHARYLYLLNDFPIFFFYNCREDVVSILVEVNRDVSQKVGQIEGGQLAVQIPEPKVRLTKKLYLFPVESEV